MCSIWGRGICVWRRWIHAAPLEYNLSVTCLVACPACGSGGLPVCRCCWGLSVQPRRRRRQQEAARPAAAGGERPQLPNPLTISLSSLYLSRCEQWPFVYPFHIEWESLCVCLLFSWIPNVWGGRRRRWSRMLSALPSNSSWGNEAITSCCSPRQISWNPITPKLKASLLPAHRRLRQVNTAKLKPTRQQKLEKQNRKAPEETEEEPSKSHYGSSNDIAPVSDRQVDVWPGSAPSQIILERFLSVRCEEGWDGETAPSVINEPGLR